MAEHSKKFAKKGIAVLLSAALLAGQILPASAAQERTDELRIAVLSDTHYLSPDMIKDTQDYTTHLNSDRKMFTESDAFLDKMFEEIKEDQPDVLMISGDLTKDGEKEGHQALADKLETLKEEVPGMDVYVVPGNHDLRNSNAMNFNTEDGNAVPAGRTEPEDYKEIYSEAVFSDDSILATYTPPEGKEAGGLSYVARPKEGYTIIAIDSARYSADNTDSGLNEHETSGAISLDLESWILSQIKAAKGRGDTVIGLQHHGMIPHFSMEPDILPMYLVNDYQRLSQEYADAGMQYIFTGHMHANDIASMTTEAGNTLYDIETGSVLTYPSPMRFVTLDRNYDNGSVNETMAVETRTHLGPITFENPLTGQEQAIEDITDYGKQHGFSVDMLSTVANEFLHGYYDQITAAGGTRAALEGLIGSLLGEQFADLTIEQLIDVALPLLLPATPEEGADPGIYYEDGAIKIWSGDGAPGSNENGIWVSIPAKALKEALPTVFETADGLFTDTELLDSVITDLVSDLLTLPVYTDETQTKTLEDLANYAYQSHLAGEDSAQNLPGWVASAQASIADGTLIDQMVDVITTDLADAVTLILDQISLKELVGVNGWNLDTKTWVPMDNRTPLIQLLNDNTATLINLVALFAGWDADGRNYLIPDDYTVADLLDRASILGIDVNELLTELISGTPDDPETEENEASEGLITAEIRQQLGAFANSVITSMAQDENWPEDNNTTIQVQWTLSDRTALNQAIAKAEAIDLTLYTQDSAATLTQALEAARNLSDSATQAEVDQATAALEAAMANLTQPSASGSDTETPDGGNSGNGTASLPQTSDTLPWAAVVAILFAGVTALGVRKRIKK